MHIVQYYSKILIGKLFFKWLMELDTIVLANQDNSIDMIKCKNKNYYKPTIKYALNFELPIDAELINLPMVSPPRDWIYNDDISSYRGGYLETEAISVLRTNALGGRWEHSLYIIPNQQTSDCLNYLQKVPYKINNIFLNFIHKNKDELIKKELMVDTKYLTINPIIEGQKEFILLGESSNIINISEQHLILKFVSLKAQATREYYILRIAELFKEYTIYFPAFLDFRGRIYRPGLLHIQTSALGKALLLWDYTKLQCIEKECLANTNLTSRFALHISYN
nr:putative DNA-directed RNA polymerase [Oedogonium sp. 210]